MATSPIYGWAEPDNTDLLKNGALAIRTLGNAIDTTMGTMTPKSTFTAKGSIAAATAASTPANLSVGANGTTLIADSGQSTGLGWVATPSASNPVLNSAMNVWQRGTSISLGASASYTVGFLADRWQTSTSGAQASTISRQATSDTTNLPFIQYCLRYQRNSGQTGTATMGFYQSLETANSIPFVGKTVTYSFYARAGANYSPTSSALKAVVQSGTGTDQSVFAYTGSASVISTTMTLTSTWQRFTATATIGSTVTELALGFEWNPTGTAGTNDYFEVTGVQLDIGSVALPFRTAGVSYQQELALCQRYLPAVNAGAVSVGYVPVVNFGYVHYTFPVTARVAPTGISIPALGNFTIVNSTNSGATPSAVAFDSGSVNGCAVGAPATLTLGTPCRLTLGASGYILFTGCEL